MKMIAIFDKNAHWVGWYDKQRNNVFNKNLAWLGFIYRNNLFARHGHWLGGLVNGTFVDKQGHPVAWLEGVQPRSTFPLLQPL